MRIGIDLGGSKIEGLILDPEGREIARRRVLTPKTDSPDKTYAATIAAITDLVGGLTDEAGADPTTGLGVGIPGAISPATGLIKNANSTCLIGRSLDKDLEGTTARPSPARKRR